MTMPHRDNAPRVAARRPSDHHEPATQFAHGDKPWLAIVAAHIRDGNVIAVKYDRRVAEINAAFFKRLCPLSRVESDAHE